MREILILAIHLLVTLAKLLRPGGVRAVAAGPLLLRHQLLISNRSRQRAPNLTAVDRFVLGLATLFVRPQRLPKIGALVRPTTLHNFHEALVQRKYRRLFSSSPAPRLKHRNPHFGCVRIAQQITRTFGVEIDKDVVRRVLAKHQRPGEGQPLERRPLPLRIDPPAQSLGAGGHRCLHPPHRRLRHRACLKSHVSTDHDPLLCFHRWRANRRVREIDQVKSVPYAPVSHPFVERLIGTIRREYLDRVFFWNAVDLARKLEAFRDYYNGHRVHRALAALTPAQRAGALCPAPAALDHYGSQQHCQGLFELPIAA